MAADDGGRPGNCLEPLGDQVSRLGSKDRADVAGRQASASQPRMAWAAGLAWATASARFRLSAAG